MYVLTAVCSNPYLAASLCILGGYALNKVCLLVNQFAAKNLGLPIDLLEHQEYNVYTHNIVEANRQVAASSGINLDRLLGVTLSNWTVIAIREEISYRFLLETIVLPYFVPQVTVFSITRTCVSSLLFAARHLTNNFSDEVLAGQFLNTALLGVVCSVAQQNIGLLGSIFVHIGYNLHAWQSVYNVDLRGTVKNIRAIHLCDIVYPCRILIIVDLFISDAINPAFLTYQCISRIGGELDKVNSPELIVP